MSNKTNPLENLEGELVDYVSNTPNNINPSVVRSMVRVAADGVSGAGTEAETMWIAAIERSGAPVTKLPAGLTSIGDNAFYGYTSLALTSLPNGITSIGEDAFRQCTNLALTSLPNGLTSIDDGAFYRCSKLALKYLPSGIMSIGYSAFNYCSNLTKLTFRGTPTTISTTTFYNCSALKTINVPWAEGEVSGAPWGASNATINYNYRGG